MHSCNVGQDGDITRSYFQGQRTDPKLALEKQSNNDARSQPVNEDMDIGYEDNPISQTFEGLEQKFFDDIMKLAKEQSNAEDAENARHREVGLLSLSFFYMRTYKRCQCMCPILYLFTFFLESSTLQSK